MTTRAVPAPLARVLLIALAGVAVGVLTSLGQGHVHGALLPLVNSASAWLFAAFAVGAWMLTRRGAAVAGLAVCTLELAAYYVTAHLRGYAADGSLVIFWAVCAVFGGPVFGAAGHLWRMARGRVRGLGVAVLAGAFFAEGLWTYVHELHYYASAALWFAIGTAVVVFLSRRLRDLGWLAVTVPIGIACEDVVTQIYT